MYNVYLKAKARPRTKTFVEFELGKGKFTLTEEHIRFGVESVQAACKVSSSSSSSVRGITSSTSLCSYELSFSCLYSRALDRFLFQDARKGACLHQTPSRVRQKGNNNTVEKVDICALPFLASFQPDGPILVADVNNSMFEAADKESLLYAVNGVSVQCGQMHWPLQIGIPGTRELSELQVYVPLDGGLWRLPIAQCSPYDSAFLCTLYVATNYLCRFGATTNLDGPPECPIPKEDMMGQWGYRPLEDKNHRVFTNDLYVFKLYDTQMEEVFHVNKSLLETAGLEDVSVTDLSIDGRLQMLKYKFISGSHAPIKIGDFRGALVCLQKVHSSGYIHGDIRIENIVFGNGTSYLIDFDLARKQEDSPCYPRKYNYFSIRHASAKASMPMDKEHDIFSMKKVMAEKFPAEEQQIFETGDLIQWIDQQS